MDREKWLTPIEMMAAEIYGYSYDNYENHLGIGNIRFDELMPKDVDTLERAQRENWEPSRTAQALEIPEERVAFFQDAYQEAKEIVEAPTLVQSYRRGVRFSIQHALEEGLEDKGSIERLVTQICYRTADFGFRLDMGGQRLSNHSAELRQGTKYDREYQQEKLRQTTQKLIKDKEDTEPD